MTKKLCGPLLSGNWQSGPQ